MCFAQRQKDIGAAVRNPMVLHWNDKDIAEEPATSHWDKNRPTGIIIVQWKEWGRSWLF